MAQERLAASEVQYDDAQVLGEVARVLDGYAGRLSPSSPWREAIEVIRDDAASSAASLSQPRRERAKRPRLLGVRRVASWLTSRVGLRSVR